MVAHATTDPALLAIANMICIAFFFLLRPGEYAHSPSDSTPFTFESVQLFLGGHRLDLPHATDAQLLTSTFASLTFDNQKNGVRGEVIGLSPSGDRLLCPNRAIARRILHLRQHHAPPATPPRGRLGSVKPPDITSTLQQSSSSSPSSNNIQQHQSSSSSSSSSFWSS